MSYPVKLVKIITPIAFAISLAACGGGEGTTFGSGGGGSGGGQQQVEKTSSIELSTSSRQLSSDGTDPVTITAIAKNKDNNAISGAKITFSVDNDATIIPDAATGSVHTATLQPGTPNNRKLTVKVTSDNITKSITVDVVGTSVVIDGPSAITLNKEVPFVLKLKDGADKKISYEAVTLTSSAGNTIITDSNFETDKNGEIAFKLVGLQGGNDILTAEVLGASVSKSIAISDDDFELSNNTKEMGINTSQLIKFFWKKSGVPQANKLIYVSATRGSLTSNSVTTNSAGEATIEISSGTAGKTVITATTVDGLSTSLTREFIATTPAYLNTQADPTLITPNKSSTIISRIRDINDNPVKNKVISFRLDDTVNGVLSGSTAVTDSLGRASVSYTAGDSSSAKDGVKITTFIQGYEGIVADDSIFLTVGSNALRIVLGEDNLIASSDVFYIKKFGVIVTDSAGTPVKDQKVDFTITPIGYYKGEMVVSGDVWRPDYRAVCEAEDINQNGSLDVGEDINGNGLLEPTHDAAVTSTGVTDENGRIVIEIVYPKSRAEWARQRITSAVVANGTEFIEHTDFTLPVVAADVKDIKISPPNAVSPYGTSGFCTDSPNVTPPPPPVVASVVDALTHAVIGNGPLKSGVWYSIASEGKILEHSDFTIAAILGKAINIEIGPNNTFRLSDGDPANDATGFYLTLTTTAKGTVYPLFFKDAAVIPADTTAPVISLNGAASVNVPVSTVYNDLGASATDVVDGVVIVSTAGLPIDTSVVGGPYIITYTATDSAGNSSSDQRSVTVVP